MAFEGLGKVNILLNIASMEHDPNESESVSLDTFPFQENSNI